MLQSRASRASRSVIGAAVVALLVAGCASGGASSPPSSPPLATSSAAPESGTYTVEVASDASLGAFLTGEDGKSLYLFALDSAGKSTCSGSCATAWPPFVLDEGETAEAGDGVTGTLGTITRDDGSTQVTINGLPLHYFAGDDGPAQTNGQGVNDVWFLAAPDGSRVGSNADAATPASEPGY